MAGRQGWEKKRKILMPLNLHVSSSIKDKDSHSKNYLVKKSDYMKMKKCNSPRREKTLNIQASKNTALIFGKS